MTYHRPPLTYHSTKKHGNAYHLLVFQLLSDVSGATARYFDPSFRKQGTGGDHERDVDKGVDGIEDGVFKCMRRRHIVRDTRRGY